MTWTRLDDTWTDQPRLEALDFATRWHYLCMIQFCSRNDRMDGFMRNVDARRCSDVPDPARCLAELAAAELISVVGDQYRIVDIDQHVPPAWVIKKAERDRDSVKRRRWHAKGDHTLCRPSECSDVVTTVDTTDGTTVDDHAGTGRDGTGRAEDMGGSLEQSATWETAVPGRPDLKVVNAS